MKITRALTNTTIDHFNDRGDLLLSQHSNKFPKPCLTKKVAKMFKVINYDLQAIDPNGWQKHIAHIKRRPPPYVC